MNKHTNDFEQPKTLTPNQARQGQTSYVFRVLILSIVLVFILFLSAYLLAESDEDKGATASLFTGDVIAEIQLPTIAPNAQFTNCTCIVSDGLKCTNRSDCEAAGV